MMRLLTLFTAISFVAGCAGFHDWHYGVGNECRARAAWYFSGEGKRGGAEFAEGWKRGYFDVSMGRPGPPVVPPAKFLSPRFQGPQGAGAISDWYEGYQFGAIAAERDGAGSQHRLPAFGLTENGGYGPTPLNAWTSATPNVLRVEPLPKTSDTQELPTPAPGDNRPRLASPPGTANNSALGTSQMPAAYWSRRPAAWHPPDLEAAGANTSPAPLGPGTNSNGEK